MQKDTRNGAVTGYKEWWGTTLQRLAAGGGGRRGSPEEGLEGEVRPSLTEGPTHSMLCGEKTLPGQGPLQLCLANPGGGARLR